MIEEADFQKIGNAAIDLCVFVEKLRLGKKHREEANKLTHNVLNLIKQTEKIKEEPLTKGRKMSKKLKIRFTKFERALTMQILEQEGSFRDSEHVGTGFPELCRDLCDEDLRDNLSISMWYFDTNAGRDEYLKNVIRWISEEQFGKDNEGMLKSGELCEVRDDKDDKWERRKLITILPRRFENRYIVEIDWGNGWACFTYARPIGRRIEPKIDGDIYTWEEE